MAAWWFPWLQHNWFNVVQTLGILGSLWLTTAALRRETRARKVADFLTLNGQHRELWSALHERAELARVLHAEVDFLAAPLTVAEEEFLNLVIVHFHSGWLLAEQGSSLLTRATLAADARAFFALPVPRLVWQKTRHQREVKFVRFVEGSLTTGGKRAT